MPLFCVMIRNVAQQNIRLVMVSLALRRVRHLQQEALHRYDEHARAGLSAASRASMHAMTRLRGRPDWARQAGKMSNGKQNMLLLSPVARAVRRRCRSLTINDAI